MEEASAQFYEELKKYNITKERISKAREGLLDLLNNKERPYKVNREEKKKVKILKSYYKNENEKDLNITGKIFKLHSELLESKNSEILNEAIGQAEMIMKRYCSAYREETEGLIIE